MAGAVRQSADARERSMTGKDGVTVADRKLRVPGPRLARHRQASSRDRSASGVRITVAPLPSSKQEIRTTAARRFLVFGHLYRPPPRRPRVQMSSSMTVRYRDALLVRRLFGPGAPRAQSGGAWSGMVMMPCPMIVARPPTLTSVTLPCSLRAVASSRLGRSMATP
jgi:hypothetical protein